MKNKQWIDALGTLDELEDHRKNGVPEGISTGWPHMDNNFTILKGQLNIVSGYPGMGKSEWVENIACNLVVDQSWVIMVYAPESHPASKHMRSLVEKIVGKQMVNDYNTEVMDESELSGAVFDIDKKFRLLSADDKDYNFDEILTLIEKIKASGRPLDMVIIDPFNELESHRPPGMSETDYIGICLKKARRLARRLDVSLWIVCHPAKPAQKNKNNSYDPPTMYDLAGSSHWFNKSDNAFIVHRFDYANAMATVFVKKIKNRHYGELGEVEFEFVPSCGRFKKPEPQESHV